MAKKIADFDPAVPNAPMTDHAQRHNAEADAIADNAQLILDEESARVAKDTSLQGQIDAIETYDPTALQAQVDANTLATEDNAKNLSEFTTATLTLANPEDIVTGKGLTISTQEDANIYFDNITQENSEATAENAVQIKNLWTVNTDRKNETEANALAITTKFSMGSTWGQLAGRS